MKRKKIFYNGSFDRSSRCAQHESVIPPVTPQELADEAVRAYEAGASTVHIHTRNPKTGEPDASLDLMRETLKLIKVRCDVVCCVTTGASQLMTLEERLAPVSEFKPERATLNAGSMNFVLSDIAKKIPDGFGWGKAVSQSHERQRVLQQFQQPGGLHRDHEQERHQTRV